MTTLAGKVNRDYPTPTKVCQGKKAGSTRPDRVADDDLKSILIEILQMMSRDSTDRRRDREIYDLMQKVDRL